MVACLDGGRRKKGMEGETGGGRLRAYHEERRAGLGGWRKHGSKRRTDS